MYFYHKTRNNFVLSLWENGKSRNILLNDEPIYKVHLSWASKTIHMLNRKQNFLYWATWNNGKITSRKLPTFLTTPTFINEKSNVYLVGIDISGVLWKMELSNGIIIKKKILKNSRLRYVDRILTPYIAGKFVLLMPSSKTNSIFQLKFANLGQGITSGKLDERRVFWAQEIHPIVMNRGIYLLIQTSLGHLYFEPWNHVSPHIAEFDWSVNGSRLQIRWKTSRPGVYSYSYVIDHKKNTEPIGEYRAIASNSISRTNLEDGFYGFHIQMKSGGTNSPIYHIPVEWRYNPDRPEITLINELSSRLIAPGKLRFFIENLGLVDYFAEVNRKPEHEPIKPLKVKKGFSKIKAKLRPGKYYLHIRCRDRRSKQFSSTNHYLFFVDPFNPEQDDTLKENTMILGELKYIQEKIMQNRDSPRELQKWVRKLKELQGKLEKDD